MRLEPPARPLHERLAAAARHRAAAVALSWAAVWASPAESAAAAPAAETGSSGRIVAVHAIPAVPLAPDAGRTPAGSGRKGRGPGVVLGGLSDLSPLPGTAAMPGSSSPASGTLQFWALTDRGPNGTVETPAGKRRTLLDPDFAPSIVRIDIVARDASEAAGDVAIDAARVGLVLPLADAGGQPLSGRPNGVGRDEPILDHVSGATIPADPDGIDSEGLLRLRDGSFWVAEEYRPSLLRVAADGRGLVRYVPAGESIPGAGMEVRDVLPAAYAGRRDNRGFEALAASPDESLLWVLLQSPLERPAPQAGAATGNVRLLAFDPAAGRPAAEHVYRLGDPSDPDFNSRGAPPADGKLSAMAALSRERLLVLEQAEGGLARFYECDTSAATDTLAWAAARPTESVEAVLDLRAAGIVAVSKRLVADLGPLLPAMSRHVHGDVASAPPLKLEGIAILGPRHVAIVNDNDFALAANPAADAGPDRGSGPRPPRTCLWIVELDRPLWSSPADRVREPAASSSP